jgi:hypothetical protein
MVAIKASEPRDDGLVPFSLYLSLKEWILFPFCSAEGVGSRNAGFDPVVN